MHNDKTIQGLVENLAFQAHEKGIDISPADVGWLIGAFCRGMAEDGGFFPGVDATLESIAEAAESVQNES